MNLNRPNSISSISYTFQFLYCISSPRTISSLLTCYDRNANRYLYNGKFIWLHAEKKHVRYGKAANSKTRARNKPINKSRHKTSIVHSFIVAVKNIDPRAHIHTWHPRACVFARPWLLLLCRKTQRPSPLNRAKQALIITWLSHVNERRTESTEVNFSAVLFFC